jgi:serine/threonine protein kinase
MSLENYKIQRLIATGGYAKVFQAVDLRTNTCVALKFIDKVREDDPTHSDDIQAEVDIFGSLNHPYVCKFHEVIDTPREVVIAMELLSGALCSST